VDSASDKQKRGCDFRRIFVNKLFSILQLWTDQLVRSAAGQMAIDEALARTVTVPVLRVYGWGMPTATFGYSQRFSGLPEAVKRLNAVRRWSGGGVVFHGSDLTLALVVPAGETMAAKKPLEFYQLLHEAILAVVRGVVPEARLVMPNECRAGGVCFESPVEFDIVANQKKICGGALRRFRGGVLYQGSLHCHGIDGADIAGIMGQYVEPFIAMNEVNRLAQVLENEKYASDSWRNLR
jgi:lipoyl(octanoyl) transferase